MTDAERNQILYRFRGFTERTIDPQKYDIDYERLQNFLNACQLLDDEVSKQSGERFIIESPKPEDAVFSVDFPGLYFNSDMVHKFCHVMKECGRVQFDSIPNGEMRITIIEPNVFPKKVYTNNTLQFRRRDS